jgi:AcrR family transcriptional regulator
MDRWSLHESGTMSGEGPRAPYQSALRARQKQQTSLIILEAVTEILRQADLAAVTFAEVARVAEVTEQTVYRHFASRDALIRAFVQYHLDQATGGPNMSLPETIDTLLAWVENRCQSWARDRKIVSEAYLSPVGRELRMPLYTIGFQNTLGLVAREYPNVAPERREQIAASMMTLMSTENFVFLYRTLGYGPEQVVASVVSSIRAMLAGIAEEALRAG